MNIIGNKTPRSPIFKSESHKLRHAFNVKSGEKIYPGNLVVIEDDGTISPFKSTSKLDRVIGYAETSSETPAYGESKQHEVEVTVAMVGYAVLWAAAGAASLKAGPVKPTGNFDTTNTYMKYTSVAMDDTTYAGNCRAINLTPATADGDPIQVLIL